MRRPEEAALQYRKSVAAGVFALLLVVGCLLAGSSSRPAHAQYPPGTLPPATGAVAPAPTAPPTTVPHHLAFTGAQIAEMAGIGTIALAAGVVMLVMARRRRPED